MQYKGGIKTSQKPPFPPSVATYIHIKIDIYMMLISDKGGDNKLYIKKRERKKLLIRISKTSLTTLNLN